MAKIAVKFTEVLVSTYVTLSHDDMFITSVVKETALIPEDIAVFVSNHIASGAEEKPLPIISFSLFLVW
jgi:hypothetical protein